MRDICADLERLDEDGFVVVDGALSSEEVQRCRVSLDHARANGWQEGLNLVGNMWFDHLLEQDPDTFRPLIAHPSVRDHLDALFGPQTQVRHLRAHINPGPYHQEWHMDFFGYWDHPGGRYCQRAVGISTIFYLQNSGPGISSLTFVQGGHRVRPDGLAPGLNTFEPDNPFHRWCEAQQHVVVYPRAGDCLLFLSHIPHRGEKESDQIERSNVVVYYQCTPMHEYIWHVAPAMGYAGTFPLPPGWQHFSR